MKSIVMFVATLLLGFAASASVDPHRAMLVELNKKNYFKAGTCQDVANTLLKQNDLPLIGQKNPVVGHRGSFDRSKEKESFPVFKDQIFTQDRSANLTVTAKKNAKQWVLSFSRQSKSGVNSQTDLTFESGSHNGRTVCELVEFDFKSQNLKSEDGKPSALKMGLNSCLDVYMQNPDLKPNRSLASEASLANSLAVDCAFAVHYWGEAKQIVNAK